MSRSRYTLLIDLLIHLLIKKNLSVSRTCASGVSYYISSSCFMEKYLPEESAPLHHLG